MEKLLLNTRYDKEYMKKAMLKHEETFKEQVNELHRLYQIQKVLMKNVGSSNDRLCVDKRRPRKHLDLERPAAEEEEEEEHITEVLDHGNGVLQIEDESEIELTLGPTNYCRRRRRKSEAAAAAETPLTSDSGPSFSSSSTGSSHHMMTMKTTSNSGTHHHRHRTIINRA